MENDMKSKMLSKREMLKQIEEQNGISSRAAYRWLRRLADMETPSGWPMGEVLDEVEARKHDRREVNGDVKRKILEEKFLLIRAERLAFEAERVPAQQVRDEWDMIQRALIQAVDEWRTDALRKYPALAGMIEELAKSFIGAFPPDLVTAP